MEERKRAMVWDAFIQMNGENWLLYPAWQKLCRIYPSQQPMYELQPENQILKWPYNSRYLSLPSLSLPSHSFSPFPLSLLYHYFHYCYTWLDCLKYEVSNIEHTCINLTLACSYLSHYRTIPQPAAIFLGAFCSIPNIRSTAFYLRKLLIRRKTKLVPLNTNTLTRELANWLLGCESFPIITCCSPFCQILQNQVKYFSYEYSRHFTFEHLEILVLNTRTFQFGNLDDKDYFNQFIFNR